ncbi:MAG: ATP-binding cassette domain-containing protein [Bacilli bacterium]|nr:ATP-binding cassette domain-containing protein [Bacilli bacterium]
MNVIETKELCKKYGKNLVVDHVNLHVPEGSIYGFVGENGSGKTTIMRLLMGLANPTSGDYSLFDISSKDSQIYKIRNQISAIVEAPSLVPTMTAKQNLEYACLYYGVKDFSIIDKVLRQVGLGDTNKKKVKNFSLGMKQRLGIAVLLLNNPKLLLLDEPMNGLDPQGIAELRELIIQLNKEGITFLISSHILAELEKVATHWGFISHGKLLKEISSEKLISECQKSIDISYKDLVLLAKALKDIGINNFEQISNKTIRIYDEIAPINLLSKLQKLSIEINEIQTNDLNVEDYYLSLTGRR